MGEYGKLVGVRVRMALGHTGILRTSWVFAIVCTLTSPAFAQRLPGTVTPDHYTLWFAPDFQKDNFRGRATIEVQLKQEA